MVSGLRLLLACFSTLAMSTVFSKQRVTHYATFGDASKFGVQLLATDHTKVAELVGTPTDNFTQLAIDGVGASDGNYKTLALLLDEASGGRCDSCRVLTQQFLATMLKLVQEKGKVEKKDGQAASLDKSAYSVTVDPDLASDEVAKMCTNEAYAGYAAHIVKGCVEILQANHSEILPIFTASIQKNKFESLTTKVCEEQLGICPTKHGLPNKPSRCQACTEVAELFAFQLRRDHRRGLHTTSFSDAMSLTKKKKKDTSYLSRAHVQARLSELCADLKLAFYLPDQPAQIVSEMCEELTTDFEDDMVHFFTKRKGLDNVREVCVGATQMCTEEAYVESHKLAVFSNDQIVAFGPTPLLVGNIRDDSEKAPTITPAEKARRVAQKDLASNPSPAAQNEVRKSESKPTSQTQSSPESIAEALQLFIDEQSARGQLTETEEEALLKAVYNLDPTVLRVYRLNQKKGPKTLLARLRLVTGIPGAGKSQKTKPRTVSSGLPSPDEL